MSVRLSEKFLKENNVIFFPHTRAEAVFIQRCLFEHGIGWKNTGKALHNSTECIANGMLVMKGVLYTLPAEGPNHFKGVICDVTALSAHFNGATAALEHRIVQLEQQVAELNEALKPAKIAKPLSRKAGG